MLTRPAIHRHFLGIGPFWLYQAARDYTGHTDVLAPSSAPRVEEIAGFWRKHLGIQRR
jgi:hypothetical protein